MRGGGRRPWSNPCCTPLLMYLQHLYSRPTYSCRHSAPTLRVPTRYVPTAPVLHRTCTRSTRTTCTCTTAPTLHVPSAPVVHAHILQHPSYMYLQHCTTCTCTISHIPHVPVALYYMPMNYSTLHATCSCSASCATSGDSLRVTSDTSRARSTWEGERWKLRDKLHGSSTLLCCC